jgi:hypothetical protein
VEQEIKKLKGLGEYPPRPSSYLFKVKKMEQKVDRNELEKELQLLRSEFYLTEEEIEGYLEFFELRPISKRTLNSGSKK